LPGLSQAALADSTVKQMGVWQDYFAAPLSRAALNRVPVPARTHKSSAAQGDGRRKVWRRLPNYCRITRLGCFAFCGPR
jgi:hypothetical protein